MARTQTTVADAITAVNTIVSSQAAALAELKALVQTKAAGGVDLSSLEVYVGDFLNSENYSVSKGSVDGYWNTLIS